MSGTLIAGLGFAALFALMALRIPIAIAMLVSGIAGYVALRGWAPLLAYFKQATYSAFASYSLSVIPIFLLMGELAARGGLGRALFGAARAFLGQFRGGMAMAAIGACAGFGAICGSSLATAATMGRVALPEMRAHGYSGALATGTVAAGGTLGILIPPSIPLVVYAILAEQNIAKLFVAAFIPGVLAAFGYALAIAVYARLYPEEGPSAAPLSGAERRAALRAIWPVALIFLTVLGGMNAGLFTPTEGASVGALGTGVVAALRGGMRWEGLKDSLLAAMRTTAMIFLIILGAAVFNVFLALTQVPQALTELVGASGLPPMAVLALMLLLYFVLGCLMEELSMILLTVPIFFPVVMGLDLGLAPEAKAIWFGILILVVFEVGLITPPVGLNVFVVNGLAPDVPLAETLRGVVPFLISDLIRVALLVAFPGITLVALRLIE